MFAPPSAIHGSTFTQLCIFIYVFFYNCFYGVYNLDSEIALISLLVPERGESLYIGLHKALVPLSSALYVFSRGCFL